MHRDCCLRLQEVVYTWVFEATDTDYAYRILFQPTPPPELTGYHIECIVETRRCLNYYHIFALSLLWLMCSIRTLSTGPCRKEMLGVV